MINDTVFSNPVIFHADKITVSGKTITATVPNPVLMPMPDGSGAYRLCGIKTINPITKGIRVDIFGQGIIPKHTGKLVSITQTDSETTIVINGN
jgi:hypothetical protein